jgi:hypothetical protein
MLKQTYGLSRVHARFVGNDYVINTLVPFRLAPPGRNKISIHPYKLRIFDLQSIVLGLPDLCVVWATLTTFIWRANGCRLEWINERNRVVCHSRLPPFMIASLQELSYRILSVQQVPVHRRGGAHLVKAYVQCLRTLQIAIRSVISDQAWPGSYQEQ